MLCGLFQVELIHLSQELVFYPASWSLALTLCSKKHKEGYFLQGILWHVEVKLYLVQGKELSSQKILNGINMTILH